MHRATLGMLLLTLFLTPVPPSHGKSKSTCSLKRVYIATMGQSDDAKQFVFLLESELVKHGFELVPDAEQAEAVLSGAVTVKTVEDDGVPATRDGPVAYVTATLVDKVGKELWRGYFTPGPSFHTPYSTDLEARASEVAKNIGRSCKNGWAKK